MAVIIFCTESNGYGDLLFGLKLAKGLRHHLKKQNYNDDVYLVTKKESIEKIQGIGADIEFGVPMTTPEKFNQLLNDGKIEVDYLISGPTFKPDSSRNMNGMNECRKMPSDIDIMLCLEYALPKDSLLRRFADTEARIYANRELTRDISQSQENAAKLLSKIQVQDSGFSKGQAGILISQDITNAVIKRRDYPERSQSIQDNAWKTLEETPKLLAIRNNVNPDQYHQKTNFTFEYSSQSKNNRFPGNTCEHFLRAQAAYAINETKNQHILAIGLEKDQKFQALERCKDQLIANGYTHIEFIDLENQNPTPVILHHDTNKPEKVYRLYYARTLAHTAMDALQLVSDRVVGLTGDQSLSEGISAMEKVIVYERLTHKEQLYSDYVDRVVSQQGDESGHLRELLSNLVMTESNDYDRLATLMHDESLASKIFESHADITQDVNLAKNIADNIKESLGEKKFLGDVKATLPTQELLDAESKKSGKAEKSDFIIDESIMNDPTLMYKIMKSNDTVSQDKLINIADTKNLISLLHMAVDCGNAHAVVQILENKRINVASLVKGQSPLLRAIKKGDNDMVKVLLDHGADLFKQISDKDKNTCYMYAFLYKINPDVFMNPLADINRKDDNGNNFIIYCMRFPNEEDFRWMDDAKAKGADFLSRDAEGNSLSKLLIESLHADSPAACAQGVEIILKIVQEDEKISPQEKLEMLADVIKNAFHYNDKDIQKIAFNYCTAENRDDIARLSGVDKQSIQPHIRTPSPGRESSPVLPHQGWAQPKKEATEEAQARAGSNTSPHPK